MHLIAGTLARTRRAPHELGDARCQLKPQSGWQVVSHSLDQDEFRAGNGFGGRPPAADVAHAVSDAVDHQRGNAETTQELRPIAGGDERDRLTSESDRIV